MFIFIIGFIGGGLSLWISQIWYQDNYVSVPYDVLVEKYITETTTVKEEALNAIEASGSCPPSLFRKLVLS